MRVFGSGPSLREIDRIVSQKMDDTVWRPVTHGDKDFGEAMNEILIWAEKYIKENDLSLWKASKVSGSIESIVFSNVPGRTGAIWRKRIRSHLLLE